MSSGAPPGLKWDQTGGLWALLGSEVELFTSASGLLWLEVHRYSTEFLYGDIVVKRAAPQWGAVAANLQKLPLTA